MVIKPGASIQGLKLEMRKALMVAEKVYKKYGRKEGITITSGTEDYAHSAGSLHPFGYAVDLRTSYFKTGVIGSVVSEIKKELGSDYDCLYEGDHIHLEYDRILR